MIEHRFLLDSSTLINLIASRYSRRILSPLKFPSLPSLLADTIKVCMVRRLQNERRLCSGKGLEYGAPAQAASNNAYSIFFDKDFREGALRAAGHDKVRR